MRKYLIATCMIALPLIANAELVRHDFIGDVEYANLGNAYGITTSSIVTGYAIYDDSLLHPTITPGKIYVGLHPEFQLRITIGNYTFSEANDTQGLGFPELIFSGTTLIGLDFNTAFSPPNYIDANGTAWGAGLNGTFQAEGDFDFSVFTPVPVVVPIPAAVWLFGSGLIGLIGMARRKANA